MHSGDALHFERDRGVCKCMACAGKREQRIMREARRRFRTRWQVMLDHEDQLEDSKQEVRNLETVVRTERNHLREDVIKTLEAEAA